MEGILFISHSLADYDVSQILENPFHDWVCESLVLFIKVYRFCLAAAHVGAVFAVSGGGLPWARHQQPWPIQEQRAYTHSTKQSPATRHTGTVLQRLYTRVWVIVMLCGAWFFRQWTFPSCWNFHNICQVWDKTIKNEFQFALYIYC